LVRKNAQPSTTFSYRVDGHLAFGFTKFGDLDHAHVDDHLIVLEPSEPRIPTASRFSLMSSVSLRAYILLPRDFAASARIIRPFSKAAE
jgi:hypothetical protein